LAGVRRARILAIPIIISSMFIWLMMSTSLAGVHPPMIARTSSRRTLMSTIIRAISRDGVLIARSAISRSIACRAM
jgi:hypothetical protein